MRQGGLQLSDRPEVLIRWRFGWLVYRESGMRFLAKAWPVVLRALQDVKADVIVRIR